MSEIKAVIMDKDAINRAVTRITYEIIEKNKGLMDLVVIGVMNKGVELAEVIADKMLSIEKKEVGCGKIDCTPFRDDIKNKDKKEITNKTQIDFDIENKKIILVDDVLYTGRTIRAAIDAIMSIGRPKQIQLAVLIDRGHRELPIRPDFVGKNVPTSASETVRVYFKKDSNENRVVII